MGIDVLVVASCEDIASHPSDALLDWLDRRFQDFEIRYVAIDEQALNELASNFPGDPVAQMLMRKVARMREQGERPPYAIELMIGW